MLSAYCSAWRMRETTRHAVDVEARLGDGRLADEQAGVVDVVVHAALDAARIGLHEHAMALAGLTSSQTL